MHSYILRTKQVQGTQITEQPGRMTAPLLTSSLPFLSALQGATVAGKSPSCIECGHGHLCSRGFSAVISWASWASMTSPHLCPGLLSAFKPLLKAESLPFSLVLSLLRPQGYSQDSNSFQTASLLVKQFETLRLDNQWS